VKPDFFKHP